MAWLMTSAFCLDLQNLLSSASKADTVSLIFGMIPCDKLLPATSGDPH